MGNGFPGALPQAGMDRAVGAGGQMCRLFFHPS